MIIGIDVGGVLADYQHNGKIAENAINTIQLMQARGHITYIVSQCGKARQLHTIDWLIENKVPILRNNQFYIDFKTKTKGTLVKQLRLDVLIDDRPKHGFAAMQNGCSWYHLSQDTIAVEKLGIYKNLYHHVNNWYDLYEYARGDHNGN